MIPSLNFHFGIKRKAGVFIAEKFFYFIFIEPTTPVKKLQNAFFNGILDISDAEAQARAQDFSFERSLLSIP